MPKALALEEYSVGISRLIADTHDLFHRNAVATIELLEQDLDGLNLTAQTVERCYIEYSLTKRPAEWQNMAVLSEMVLQEEVLDKQRLNLIAPMLRPSDITNAYRRWCYYAYLQAFSDQVKPKNEGAGNGVFGSIGEIQPILRSIQEQYRREAAQAGAAPCMRLSVPDDGYLVWLAATRPSLPKPSKTDDGGWYSFEADGEMLEHVAALHRDAGRGYAEVLGLDPEDDDVLLFLAPPVNQSHWATHHEADGSAPYQVNPWLDLNLPDAMPTDAAEREWLDNLLDAVVKRCKIPRHVIVLALMPEAKTDVKVPWPVLAYIAGKICRRNRGIRTTRAALAQAAELTAKYSSEGMDRRKAQKLLQKDKKRYAKLQVSREQLGGDVLVSQRIGLDFLRREFPNLNTEQIIRLLSAHRLIYPGLADGQEVTKGTLALAEFAWQVETGRAMWLAWGNDSHDLGCLAQDLNPVHYFAMGGEKVGDFRRGPDSSAKFDGHLATVLATVPQTDFAERSAQYTALVNKIRRETNLALRCCFQYMSLPRLADERYVESLSDYVEAFTGAIEPICFPGQQGQVLVNNFYVLQDTGIIADPMAGVDPSEVLRAVAEMFENCEFDHHEGSKAMVAESLYS